MKEYAGGQASDGESLQLAQPLDRPNVRELLLQSKALWCQKEIGLACSGFIDMLPRHTEVREVREICSKTRPSPLVPYAFLHIVLTPAQCTRRRNSRMIDIRGLLEQDGGLSLLGLSSMLAMEGTRYLSKRPGWI